MIDKLFTGEMSTKLFLTGCFTYINPGDNAVQMFDFSKVSSACFEKRDDIYGVILLDDSFKTRHTIIGKDNTNRFFMEFKFYKRGKGGRCDPEVKGDKI